MTERKNRVRKASVGHTVDSVIVHDMKNLCFRLSALLQNVDSNYENPIFKQSMVEILGDTIRKMDSIVKRFREHQQQVIVQLQVDLNRILEDILNRLPAKATRHTEIDRRFTEIPRVWGDSYYLQNAFQSIIENALDAMPDGGTLRITTKKLSSKRRKRVSVEISDTGAGMSQSFIDSKLFRPFLTTKPEGLGLGLYTCYQIVSLHEGEITVKSKPGKGTTFRVQLPYENDDA